MIDVSKIKIGDIFTYKNIKITRPGTGISPMKIDEYINQISTKNYSVNDLIE